jgi:molecular chaperone DnaK
MGYSLGVDVGTTKTAAAVLDGDRIDAVQLGSRSAVVPSAVFRTDDGGLLFGEAADRCGVEEPERVAREFKRRVGDHVPLLVGGTPMAAQRLMALTVGWVIERTVELRGESPENVVVACPANWGPYKREAFVSALDGSGIQATLASEPECAAARAGELDLLPDGDIVAVYDLGGGTFDAAVLRKSDGAFHVVGPPQGIETLGGADADQAVFAHVWDTIGASARDRVAVSEKAELAALRREVIEAKEHLSEHVNARISVGVDGERRRVLMQRSELEERVQPLVDETVDCLMRAVTRAGLDVSELGAVLLVGGASRMPLVAERVAAAFGAPVVRDTHPQLSVALGAAVLARPADVESPPAPPAPEIPDPPEPPDPRPRRSGSRRRAGAGALAAAALMALTAAVALATTGSDDDYPAAKSRATPSAAVSALPTATVVRPATTPVTSQVVVTIRGAAGLGAVRSAPGGVDCRSGRCSFAFAPGTVTLRATTLTRRARFRGWTGACRGTGACTLTVTGAGATLAVSAGFAEAVPQPTGRPEPEPERRRAGSTRTVVTERPPPTSTTRRPRPTFSFPSAPETEEGGGGAATPQP